MLEGRVALVVGGSRGIGAAISRRLAAEGAAVAIVHCSHSDEARQLAREIESGGGSALVIKADASLPGELLDAVAAAKQRFGPIHILVNVAGTADQRNLNEDGGEAFNRLFALNVRAPFLAAQAVMADMPDGGRIITIGSIVADHAPGAGVTLYAASKSALGGLTRGLARDLGGRGITVNLIQPGPIDTERNPADGPNAEQNRAPLAIRRHGTPAEVAGLVAYLASPEAAFVTGSTYNIDGGWSA
jgi:3-oxoacyl-[acyl-carrier protein] reductase